MPGLDCPLRGSKDRQGLRAIKVCRELEELAGHKELLDLVDHREFRGPQESRD
tara:strand:+ start:1851 stop:2009 length:159 start_codon:yes stop_codon:yes gene_type:complete